MDASIEHRDYVKIKFDYRKVRDCYKGSTAVKDRRETYLPIPNPQDTTALNMQKYANYLLRAVFLNVIAPTIDTMVGSIFRRDPRITLPEEIKYIEKDAAGAQVPLLEFSKEAVTDLAQTGRLGILVDQYPSEATNKADEEAEGVLPRFTMYQAESIIQWHESVIDGICRPDLIVLNEVREEKDLDNECNFKVSMVQRKLAIQDGIYTQTLWDRDKQLQFDTGHWTITPTKTGGIPFNYIPFVFVGMTSNTAKVDQPPLLPLAEINLGHYRNSADLEEACFLAGQPTLVMTGLEQAWVDKNLKSGVMLGSGSSIPLPKGGDAKLLQASPNNLVSEEMQKKEERMLKVGLRATDGTRGRETATAATIRISTDEALMIKLSTNVSLGINQALNYLYDYVTGELPDTEDEIVFRLNKIFYSRTVDPQLILALIDTFEKGFITFEELRDNLLEMGVTVDEESDIEELKATYKKYAQDLKEQNQPTTVTAVKPVDSGDKPDSNKNET